MTVRVLLFAGLRERLRSDSVTLVLPAGATVGQLLAALAEQHPTLRALLPPVPRRRQPRVRRRRPPSQAQATSWP
jgi:molybdopterin converting factor small subunit